MPNARKVDPAAEAARQARLERLDAARLAWGMGDERTRQRTAMVIAGFLLKVEKEDELADWLVLARPEHGMAVATGVAVHALRRGVPAAWDVLVAGYAMNIDQAVKWFEADRDFVWSPDPQHLYEDTP